VRKFGGYLRLGGVLKRPDRLKIELKRLSIVMLIFLCAALVSCSGMMHSMRTATDIMADTLSSLGDVTEIPSGIVYFYGAEPYSSAMLSGAQAGYMYYGKYEQNDKFALLDDYAVRISDRPEMFEIHILKAKNRSDAIVLKEMLESRLRILKSGNLEAYDYHISHDLIGSAEIFIKGKYAVMLITEDNGAAKKALLESIG